MIIVDTNVILSALLTEGITKVVLTAHKDVFMTPKWCLDELWKHREVWNKNYQSDNDLKNMVSRLKRYVEVIDENRYKSKLNEAERLITDSDDAPLIALALSVENEGIWTYNTKHFNKDSIQKSKKSKSKICAMNKKSRCKKLTYSNYCALKTRPVT